jgi:NAD(P)H-hydrate epimerase
MRPAIPAIPAEAMAGIDRTMMRDLGVDTLQLMELAGYGVAEMARRHAGLDLASGPAILALAGTGGNGGDAMVAARLLHAWGATATVLLSKPRADIGGTAGHQLAILERMGIPVIEPGADALPDAGLIIDGLFGFSLSGDPRGEAARLIRLANAHPAPILAIDVPSGLDATTGHAGDPCIAARWTITLALPKTGLLSAPDGLIGDLWLADIGVPLEVYARIGIDVPRDLFSRHGLVRIG